MTCSQPLEQGTGSCPVSLVAQGPQQTTPDRWGTVLQGYLYLPHILLCNSFPLLHTLFSSMSKLATAISKATGLLWGELQTVDENSRQVQLPVYKYYPTPTKTKKQNRNIKGRSRGDLHSKGLAAVS